MSGDDPSATVVSADLIEATLRRRLTRLARRNVALRILRDLGLAIGVLGLLLLCAALWSGDDGASPVAKVLLPTLGLLAGLFTLYVAALLGRLRRPHQLARIVGARAPRLSSDLLSAVELAEERRRGPAPAFSLALYRALLRRTLLALGQIPAAHIAPAAALRPAAMLLGAVALAWGAAATLAPQTLASRTRQLLADDAGAVRVAPRPLVGDLRLRYRFPAYLRRAPQSVRSSTGQITAPLGSHIELSMRPLGEGPLELRVEEDGKVPRTLVLTPRPGGDVGCTLEIRGGGRYHIERKELGGLRLRDPSARRIDVEVDAPPRITLFGPPDGLDVGHRQRIEVGFVASDDHGLSQVRLAYRRPGGATKHLELWPKTNDTVPPAEADKPRKKSVSPAPGQRKRAQARHAWDLAPLGLAKGGRVAYWIEAVDNDTVSGPKVSRSTIRHLRTFSAAEKHDRTLARHKQLLEEALLLLSPRSLLYSELRAQGDVDVLRAQRGLHRRGVSFADALRAFEVTLSKDRLSPTATRLAFAAMARRLGALLRKERRLLESLAPGSQLNAKAQTQLQRRNTEHIAELERDALTLANLLEEQKLQQIAEAARDLEASKRELAKLLARYRKSKDPKLRERILQRIATLERQINRLLGKLAKLQTTLPDEYINREAVKNLSLATRAQKLAELFKGGKLDALDRALAALDDKLGAMRKLLAGNLQTYRDQRLGAREKAYSKLMDRLHELENEQRAVGKATEAIAKEYRRRAKAALSGALRKLLAAQRSKLARLQRELAAAKPNATITYLQSALLRAKKRAQWLDKALAAQDLGQALEISRRLAASLELLDADLRGALFARWLRRGRDHQSKRHVSKAYGLAKEIRDDLRRALPKPKDLLPQPQLARLRKLRRRQRELAQRAQALRRKLHKSRAPLGSAVRRGLGQAKELMESASTSLGGARPQRAREAQGRAASKLAKLRGDLRRSRQPRSGGRAAARQKVEIPGAESFQAPRAFRRDIMDAMKEKAPKAFEAPVRRYYRELVR